MTCHVQVHKKAREYYGRQQEKSQKRLKKALKELSKDPFSPRPNANIKKLSGTKGRDDAYRIRVGDYRIVYTIEKKRIYVTLIFQRGKEYREL